MKIIGPLLGVLFVFAVIGIIIWAIVTQITAAVQCDNAGGEWVYKVGCVDPEVWVDYR